MEKPNLTVRKLPDPPEAPEEPDMNAVYIKAYEGKVDDLIKLLAKAAGSKDGAKIIKRLPGFDGKNDIKELQKNPEAFIKSFLKNEEDLKELLETIQDSKLGDKLMTLLEKTPAGQELLKDISENIENELTEYNAAMLQYEENLTAYETALDEFINPVFLPVEDEAEMDEIIAAAEAEAEAELSVEEAEEAAADALAETEEEEEITAAEELLLTEEEVVEDEETISDEEIVIEEEIVIDEEVVSEEEITQG
jgi:hypothetical protein